MVIPTGLTTMKCKKKLEGFVEYTCEHCGQHNIQQKITEVNKETTGHILFSPEHEAKISAELNSAAIVELKAQESKLYVDVNVKHNYNTVRHQTKCIHCGKKQSWNTKKGKEVLNENTGNAPVYFNRMDCVLKRCSHCGNQEKEENRFCTVCGSGEFFEPKTELLTKLFNQSEMDSIYQNIANEIKYYTPTVTVRKENTKCKISFWAGVFSIFLFLLVVPQFISIYFGIRGLREIKTRNEKGKAFAIAGLVLSSLSSLLAIVMLPSIFGL